MAAPKGQDQGGDGGDQDAKDEDGGSDGQQVCREAHKDVPEDGTEAEEAENVCRDVLGEVKAFLEVGRKPVVEAVHREFDEEERQREKEHSWYHKCIEKRDALLNLRGNVLFVIGLNCFGIEI